MKVSAGPGLLVPSGVVTMMSTEPTASAGAVAVIDRSEVATNDADDMPNATMVAPVKPEPVMMTVVPPVNGPELGRTPVTVGGV